MLSQLGRREEALAATHEAASVAGERASRGRRQSRGIVAGVRGLFRKLYWTRINSFAANRTGTAAAVQVFGRRRHQASPRARTAGVQKAPGHEVAGSRAAAGRRALWGFQVSGAFDGGATLGRRDLDACTRRRAREGKKRPELEFEGCRRAPGAWIALNRVERDRRRRGASATEREGGGADGRSGS